jgi:uncharacterized protein (TIGR02284 family)
MTTQTQTRERESSKELIFALNRCIETCMDGEKGYALAAADVRAPELKSLLHKYSEQRGNFVLALQDAIRKLGGFPENEGSFGGPIHRGWMSLRRMIEGRDDRVILQDCIMGEEAAIRAYEAVDRSVTHVVPEELRALLQDQYAEIHVALARLRAHVKALG